jgi:hypothetical protein
MIPGIKVCARIGYSNFAGYPSDAEIAGAAQSPPAAKERCDGQPSVSWRGATPCPELEEYRNWLAQAQTVAFDPGCVKTLFRCYDSSGDSGRN